MIDGNFKHVLDRGWDRIGRLLAKSGLSANAVTWLGLILMIALCGSYIWHQNQILFAVGLVFVFSFDSLDGAVARATGTESLYGGYLDAVLDRYQEVLVLAVLAFVHSAWAEAFFAVTGALVISYNKARTAIEIPIDNTSWPDFFERLERVLYLFAVLIVIGIIGNTEHRDVLGGTDRQVSWMMIVFAALAYGTSIQRFLRARRKLKGADRSR